MNLVDVVAGFVVCVFLQEKLETVYRCLGLNLNVLQICFCCSLMRVFVSERHCSYKDS